MDNSGKHMTKWQYEDIVDLPHHVSKKHPAMSPEKRAAQFAPFAALTGYDAAIAETARRTDEMISLSDTALEELNRKLMDALSADLEVTITYYVPDKRKNGGSYAEASGRIRKVEMGTVVMENGAKIQADRIVSLD
jgi:hypothetical protein